MHLYFLRPCQLLAAIIVLSTACSSTSNQEQVTTDTLSMEQSGEASPLLFIGTYTRTEGHVDGKAEGIYVYEFNKETGAISQASVASGIINPSYLTLHPSGAWLYAVSETGGEGTKDYGSVHAYKIDRQGKKLTALNQASSQGKYPCYISTDAAGKSAFVANYGGGIAALPLADDGRLQEASSIVQHSGKGPTDRQESPHAHMIIPGPDEHIFAVDLGTDKVYAYSLNDQKQLVPTTKPTVVTAGAGPRHLTFHPKQNKAYVINELNGTIEAFNISPENGALERFQTISTLQAHTTAAAASADIHIHPSGKFLYASNRGEHNNIAIYAISSTNGELQLLGHQPSLGKTPRNFVIDPSGKFLLVANQDSRNVVSFRIDQESGLLTEVANTPVPTPVCLKFLEN
ncbi:MAG: lactonase family protein [Bacteroidetes bacterium]|nr:lactonase family protein [Bacteroidota bacterium]